MNIQDPWHNIREACKQALLLEDHLFHKAKNCPDCISKHLLMMEALLEEAITLDETGGLQKLLESLLARVWIYQTFWVSKRVTNRQLAQALRKWRKGILVTSFMSKIESRPQGKPDWKEEGYKMQVPPGKEINWDWETLFKNMGCSLAQKNLLRSRKD